MGTVLSFPSDADAAWNRYQRLASALADDVGLADRQHMQEMARAEAAWKAAYLAQGSKA